MALPTEILPKQAGDLNETPAYFDQAKNAKQLEQDKAKARRKPIEPKAGTAEPEEDQTGQVVEEYQPFPINPEEEEDEQQEDGEENEENGESEGEEGSEGEEVKSEEQQLVEAEQKKQAEIEQAKQLAEQQKKSKLLQKLAQASEKGDVANIATEEGSKQLLEWACKLCWAIFAGDITGTSLVALIYLNAHIICRAQGFSPFGLKLSKPEMKHYLVMIIMDLSLFIVALVVISILIILIQWQLNPVGFIYDAVKNAIL